MDNPYDTNQNANITFTPTGKPVMPDAIDDRLARVDFLLDYRLEQLDKGSYRIQVIPEPDRDLRGLRGAVLDALVDVYGMQGDFNIDVILEDSELLPKVPSSVARIRRMNECR